MIRALLAALCVAGPASALELNLPVDCDMRSDCYIQSYPDRDTGAGAVDYTCGGMSYDGHKGLDIRVSSMMRMRQGVDIIAAAPGRVRAVRDGEPDTGARHFATGKDCGNAVAISHGDGWETQYCHLRKGSVSVRPGQVLNTGDVMGQMGLSGNTEFPHLHLSVRRNDRTIDPFNGVGLATRCGVKRAGIWSRKAAAALSYIGGGVVDAGFASRPVELAEVREHGEKLRTTGRAAMVLWARFYGLRAGDVMTLNLTGPSGFNADSRVEFDRNRAEHLLFAGRRTSDGWRSGQYTGSVRLIRNGETHDEKIIRMQVD